MLHNFPYDDFDPVEIPNINVSGVYSPGELPPAQSQEQIILAALNAPIGSGRLCEQVKPAMKITIAVDDSSRSTHTELMLPMVLAEIASVAVPKQNVTIFVALGTHRLMTDSEMRAKYTPQIVDNYRTVNPDWKDVRSYIQVGQSHDGLPIKVHREILQSDYVVGVGQAIPHMIAGFGGGCKIINPGCSDGQTIGQMHWMCTKVPEGELFAVRENPVREVIDSLALKAGLRFIINEVPGRNGIADAFAGHPIEAHRKACEFTRKLCEVRVEQKADIVIADSYPADIDFWQAIKGLNAAYRAVRDGGTVILVTTCPEGTSSQHDELTKFGYSLPLKRINSMVNAGALDKVVAANLFLGRQLLDKADTILVTKGISQKDTLAMGLQWAPSPAEALKAALCKHGKTATINVLYKASKMICVVE